MNSDGHDGGTNGYISDSREMIDHIPEASKRGITLRGLRKFQSLLEKISAEGRYFGESDFKAISTNDIVNKFVLVLQQCHHDVVSFRWSILCQVDQT